MRWRATVVCSHRLARIDRYPQSSSRLLFGGPGTSATPLWALRVRVVQAERDAAASHLHM